MELVSGVAVPIACVPVASSLHAYSAVLSLPSYLGNHIHEVLIGMVIGYVVYVMHHLLLLSLSLGVRAGPPYPEGQQRIAETSRQRSD